MLSTPDASNMPHRISDGKTEGRLTVKSNAEGIKMFGIEVKIILAAIVVIVIAVAFVITIRRNRQIRRNGIKAEAVVSRIEEHDHADSDGSVTTTYSYYVTYLNEAGETREALLSKVMHSRYCVGDELEIQYLPEKPQYAFPVKKS